MASSQKQFPAQQQGSQPGKEHAMDPRPEAILQHYKAASKLKDKVALVTGGDSGIGRAVCLLFAAEGASVAFTFVKGHEDADADETLRALRDIARRTGARDPMALPADLGYEDGCRKVVEEVAAAHGGRIDVLVNNAAEQHERGAVTEVTESDLDRVFRTNIFSYFLVTKHAVAHMGGHGGNAGGGGGGCIINTASVNAYKGHKTLLETRPPRAPSWRSRARWRCSWRPRGSASTASRRGPSGRRSSRRRSGRRRWSSSAPRRP